MMEEKNYLPQAISHKKLSLLMLKAKKDNLFFSDDINPQDKEIEEFFNTIDVFEKASKELMNKINKVTKENETIFLKKSSNSVMALGAMEAHLNMALQAMSIFKNDPNK